MSNSWFGQSVLLGLRYVSGPKMLFWWFSMSCSSSSMKEPYMYMHCCGLYLGLFYVVRQVKRGGCIDM